MGGFLLKNQKENFMKKLFISQPMKGKSDKEILAERENAIAAIKDLLKEDVEVVESFFQGVPADAKPLWFLGEAIKLLSTADVVYFCKGWKKARGCLIEHLCAKKYNIDVID